MHFIYERAEEIRNSPSGVLAAIDEYGRLKKYLMNVGPYKGKIVTELIQDHKPKTMVELGGYVGYSSILFGDAFKRSGGQRYYTLESSPEFAAVIMALVKLAGLDDVVEVLVGDSGASLERLHREKSITNIDMLFIDHIEFERDIKLCERLDLVSPGTLVAADNCVYPGQPEYWSYMTASVEERRAAFNREEDERKRGNPDLIYESRLAEGFEPSGEKVSRSVTRSGGSILTMLQDAVGISKCTGKAAKS